MKHLNSTSDRKVVLVLGPTASGKTAISIETAKLLSPRAEIVNFDSLYFYKELNIGTAKPTLEEMEGIPHHLISICSIKDEMNAAYFVKEAEQAINNLLEDGKIPLLVGGSAFYVRALLKGMYPQESTFDKENSRKKLDSLLKTHGISFFVKELEQHDPLILKKLHCNDHYRIMRAYEYYLETGKPISSSKTTFDESNPYDFSTNIHNWNTFQIYLDMPRDEHFCYIEKRAREMLQLGLVEEVEKLLATGSSGQEKALNSIGYKESQQFLNGTIKSKEALIERIAISTRQLAKSQRTFFKKISPKCEYHPIHDRKKITEDVLNFINKSERCS